MAKVQLPETYTFPAILEDFGDRVIVKFPDFKECYATCKHKQYDSAIAAGKDQLSLQIQMMELKRKPIPSPTPIEKVGVGKKQVVCLIAVDMKLFRAKFRGNSVKQSIVIPEYLKILGERKHIDFSKVITDALEGILGKNDK